MFHAMEGRTPPDDLCLPGCDPEYNRYSGCDLYRDKHTGLITAVRVEGEVQLLERMRENLGITVYIQRAQRGWQCLSSICPSRSNEFRNGYIAEDEIRLRKLRIDAGEAANINPALLWWLDYHHEWPPLPVAI